MIRLERKELPRAIKVRGQSFLLNTDFRIWLKFPEKMQAISRGEYSGYKSLFVKDFPPLSKDTVAALNAFYNEPKEVPRKAGGGERVLDYDIDADYIYAAFLQVYGIDLVEVELHWHKFSALLSALPEDTLIVKIMGWRAYSGNPKDWNYKQMIKLKEAWALPLKETDEERKAREEFDALF